MTMAPIPSKRRKLDHPDPTLGSTDLDRSLEDDEGSMEEEDAVSGTATTLKSANRRPPQGRNSNEGALYAGGTYKSSIFKLQVDEMLAEVQPSYENRMGWVDEALNRLHGVIGAIENREPLLVGTSRMI